MIDKEELLQLYKSGQRIKDLLTLTTVPRTTLVRYLRNNLGNEEYIRLSKLKSSTRKLKENKINSVFREDRALLLYDKKVPVWEIAQRLSVKTEKVWELLESLGIATKADHVQSRIDAVNKGLEKDCSCKYCNKLFFNVRSKNGHQMHCSSNPGKVVPDNKGRKHSSETKKKLSGIRTKYIAENPDKAIFNYRASKAEQTMADFLKQKSIEFEPQFNDKSWNRGFAADFFLVGTKYILEVNGAFKYKDGILSDYYLERQKIIEDSGYIVKQIYYSKVYDKAYLDGLMDSIL